MQTCLDDIIDDSKFTEVVKERLSEWDGNVESDQFIAVWSAADYRMKYLNTLSEGQEKIDRLMKLFEERGFIPQFDVCGPQTIEIHNMFMSPRGDVVTTLVDKYNSETRITRPYLTVILAGTMRPLMMIAPGISSNLVHKFSNSSRYLAVLTDKKIDIWDIFNLKKIQSKKIVDMGFNSIIKWSSDESHILISTNTKKYFLPVEGGRIRVLSANKNRPADIELNEDGTVAMFLYTDGVQFIDTDSDKILSDYSLPITFSGTALTFYQNSMFIIIAGGFILRSNVDQKPEIVKDYRGKIELSMHAKHQVEYEQGEYQRFDRWSCVPRLDERKIIFENQDPTYGCLKRCSINPFDLSYEVSSDVKSTEKKVVDPPEI